MASTFLPSHDIHIHTHHCGHAEEDATVANIVARAEELGLACLGISEHVIFEKDAERIPRIRSELESLSRNGSMMTVLIGVEMDPDPVALDGRPVAMLDDVDYRICAPHRLPESGVGHWKFQERNFL